MSYSGSAELRTLEEGAPKYNAFLTKTFSNLLDEHGVKKNEPILDFGAGIGSLATLMRDRYGFDVHCLEIDPHQCEILESRQFVNFKSLEDIRTKYKGIYTSNVLEHIYDDEKTLRLLHLKATSENGVLIIYVPALNFLFSPLDKKLGHWRRYSKKQLKKIVESSGWRVTSLEYVDCLGVIGWIIQKFQHKIFRTSRPTPKLVKIYDAVVFPISRILDVIGMRRIIGKNILLIAKKS